MWIWCGSCPRTRSKCGKRGRMENIRVAGGPGDPNEDPFCSFWKGDDPRVHAELCGVLEEAGIPHNTVYRRDHLFNLRNYAAFEVGVPFSMYERAENVVKEAYGTERSFGRRRAGGAIAAGSADSSYAQAAGKIDTAR